MEIKLAFFISVIMTLPHSFTQNAFATMESCSLERNESASTQSLSQEESLIDAERDLGNVSRCEWIDFHGQEPLLDHTLSPTWAQEYIGADLARKFMEKQQGLHKIPVAMIEGGFGFQDVTGEMSDRVKNFLKNPAFVFSESGHSAHVANLFNGRAPYGVGLNAILDSFAIYKRGSTFDHATKMTQEIPPRVIHISAGASDTERVRQNLRQLTERSIVVVSAGDDYPLSLEEGLVGFRGIIVGSLSPHGLLSSFSQEGEGVTILAPSDHWLQSEQSGEMTSLKKTIGAASLVSGAISNLLSFVPGLTQEQVKVFLTRSALPTVNVIQEPRRNGHGTLNAYKLVRLGERLKSMGASERAHAIVHESSPIYDFSDEAAVKQKEGMKLLMDRDCSSVKKGFHLLRESFLLDPKVEFGKQLATIYDELGLKSHAKFYKSFEFSKLKENIEAGLMSEVQEIRHAALRTVPLLGDSGVSILWNAAVKGDFPEIVLGAAASLGERGIPIYQELAKQIRAESRGAVIKMAHRFGDEGKKMIQSAIRNPFEKGSTYIHAVLLGDDGLRVLEDEIHRALAEAPTSFNGNTQQMERGVSLSIFDGLVKFGHQSFELFQKVLKKENQFGRLYIIKKLSDLGPEGVILIKNVLKDSPSEQEKEEVVLQIIRLWAKNVPIKNLGDTGIEALEWYERVISDPEKEKYLENLELKIVMVEIKKEIKNAQI